jgi:hypothetical protein
MIKQFIKEVIKPVTVFFKGSLFLLGVLLFFFCFPTLLGLIKDLYIEGMEGVLPIDAPDSERQINVLKNGFIVLWLMGLIIISLLMMSFFKDWYKDYKKEESKN